MSQVSCPQEEQVLDAVHKGTWHETFHAHVAECGVCREIVRVSRWMQMLAESPERTPLPDASLVWRRVQLSERQAEAERAQKLLDWAELMFATLLSAGLAGWTAWNWGAIQTGSTSFLVEAWQHLLGSWVIGVVPILSLLSLVIVPLAAIVVAYPLLVRE